MIRLLLMRHAEAEAAADDARDFSRNLTEAGRQVAAATGRLLRSLQIQPELVLASAAHRTRQTAEDVVSSAGWPVQPVLCKSLYNASVATIMAELRAAATEGIRGLMCVGHNPGIGSLMCRIADRMLSVPPGTVVIFRAKTLDDLLRDRTSGILPDYVIRDGRPEDQAGQ